MANIATLSNTFVVVGTDETCEVTVAALETLISNAGDSYFGDSANWSSIQVEYRSTTGKQREVCTIDPSSPTGIFKVSAKARQEGWVIHEIRIRDFDGDIYKVKKADMVAADYNEPLVSGPAIEEWSHTVSPVGLVHNGNPDPLYFRVLGQQFTHSGTGTYNVDRIHIRLQKGGSPTSTYKLYIAPDNDRGNPIYTSTAYNSSDVPTVADYVQFEIPGVTLTDGVKYMFYIRTESGGVQDSSNYIMAFGDYQNGGNSYRNSSYGVIDGNDLYANGLAGLDAMSVSGIYDFDFKIFGSEN